MEVTSKGLSEYELARLERIKENQKIIDELFPEGTNLELPFLTNTKSISTPETKLEVTDTTVRVTRRKLKFTVRRNPRRSVNSLYAEPGDYYDGPLTRAMKNKIDNGGKELVDGLEDDQQVKRIIYRAPRKRKLVEEDLLPVELDDRPGCDIRLVKRVVDNCKQKVYDRINGTTCHQCRQKTRDQKTVCHNKNCSGVRGQFCGPCLKNRYGEDIREKLLDPEWVCPPCRGKCNCSFCLPKKGRPPTGIMIHIAKEAGFDSVQEYLERSNYNY